MNLLQKLWGWLRGLFIQEHSSPLLEPPPESVPVVEQAGVVSAPEPAQEVVADLPVSEILKEILLSERIGEDTIEKLQIPQLFEEWYEGECSREAIRQSISDFKSDMGGAINAKLNRIK